MTKNKIIWAVALFILVGTGVVFRKEINDKLPYFRTTIVDEVEVTKTTKVFPEVEEQKMTFRSGQEIVNDTASPMKIKSKSIKGEIVLMPSAKIKLLETKKQYKEKASFNLFKGKAKVKMKKLGWKESFTIKSPTSVVGVRGTIYSLNIRDDGSTDILVPEGSVFASHPDSKDELVIAKGEKVNFKKEGAGVPEKMTSEEIEEEASIFASQEDLQARAQQYKDILDRTWPGSSNGFRLIEYKNCMLSLNNNLRVRHLDALKEFPLTYLSLKGTKVQNLWPIENMEIYHLSLWKTPVTNLTPIEKLPLTFLNLEETEIQDLSSLKGKKLVYLYLGKTKIKDLSPLEGMELKMLTLWNTAVTDINVLKGMPLRWLSLSGTRVDDLTPLEGNQFLKTLALQNMKVKGLETVTRLPVEELLITPKLLPAGWEKLIQSMTSLKVLATNNEEFKIRQSPERFWENVEEGRYR